MREADAQAVLLVRAFEESDTEGRLLSAARRTRATQEARAAARGDEGAERLLVRRAEPLLEHLETEVPLLRRVLSLSRVGSGLAPLVLLIALAVGLGSNALGPSRQINVMFAPLLGLVAWNLLVYLVLLVGAVLGRRPPALAPGPGPGPAKETAHPASRDTAATLARSTGFVTRVAEWLVERALLRPQARRLEDKALVGASLARFGAVWGKLSVTLVTSRLARLLHLGAVVLVVGAVAGMYVRGLGLLYRASWQSTFLEPEQVQGLLRFVLGPAAALLGQSVPDVATLQYPGEGDAAPWIHLYAVTGALFVLLPRSLLLVLEGRRARALAAAVPVDLGATYFRRLLAPDRGGGRNVDVLPYGLHPGPRVLDALRALLHDLFGTRADIRVAESLAYGDDVPATGGGDDSAPDAGAPPEDPDDDEDDPSGRADCRLVLFALAQSPEPEVHGRFVEDLKAGLHEGEQLGVIVDASGYRDRVGDAERRLEERCRAWDRVLRETGVVPVHVELERPAPPDTLELLGAALWPAARAGEGAAV